MQVLRSMEESGKVRRGHFVEGLDGRAIRAARRDRSPARRTHARRGAASRARRDRSGKSVWHAGRVAELERGRAITAASRGRARGAAQRPSQYFTWSPARGRLRAFDDNADVWQTVMPALRRDRERVEASAVACGGAQRRACAAFARRRRARAHRFSRRAQFTRVERLRCPRAIRSISCGRS